MGNLIIKKVIYNGDKYYYESPELNDGINIITGDNGSGKSTFTYFIEYCLGGYLKYFNAENSNDKYEEILDDTNNYVELHLFIDSEKYLLKRFISGNTIHINHNDNYFSYPIYRQQSETSLNNEIFSDWLLSRLSIASHELNLGTRTWKLNINDLLRLVIYDQDTPSKRIFKDPTNLNHITDSLIIRKTVFEVLLGISSDEYFRKYDELKIITLNKEKEQLKLDNFKEKYAGINLNSNKIQEELDRLNLELARIHNQRDLFLSSNNQVDEKTILITKVQQELINKEIKFSDVNIELQSVQIEYNKIVNYFQTQSNEINEIEKIIFTNDKLNLFAFKICPFCMSEHEPLENLCLCGAEIIDKDYEKFRYTSKEYENILKHKKKSLETIQIALDSYVLDINKLQENRSKLEVEIKEDTNKLKALISSTNVATNTKAINLLHDQILDYLKKIEAEEYKRKILNEKSELDLNYNKIVEDYKRIKSEFEDLQKLYENENRSIISDFNSIYGELLLSSSADIKDAQINEDYMPIVDNGVYKNKSAGVPIRLIYYYTILLLALKYESVKHPKLLIIDTPEDSGIDSGNLKNDLQILDDALKQIENKNQIYQVILTTGLHKYPTSFKKYIVERFNKDDKNFILKAK